MIRFLAIAAALVFTSATSFAGKNEKKEKSVAATPEARFAKLDSNSDGSLSLDEFKQLKSADKAQKPKAAAKKKAGKKAAAKPAKKAPKKAAKKKDNAKAKKPSKKKGDAKAKKADKGKGKKKHGKARKK